MQNRIAQNAQQHFFKHGYSRVTLTEIATEMGISKKTIYNHFSGKEELLYAVLDSAKVLFDEQVFEIEKNVDLTFRETVLEMLSVLGMWITKLKIIVADLQRNNIAAYQYLLQLRKKVIIDHAMRILKKGKTLEMLDDNNRSAVAVFLFLASAEKITDDDFRNSFPAEITNVMPHDPVAMFQSVLEVIYHGIKKS